ncbi:MULTISPECIES: hypothetical protein, partial [unclassified Arthrobacter]|uniref:hypothetical protein n=1 Tax=unclassified Arthrobacter TaxID=235627 RepID=UPI002E0775FD
KGVGRTLRNSGGDSNNNTHPHDQPQIHPPRPPTPPKPPERRRSSQLEPARHVHFRKYDLRELTHTRRHAFPAAARLRAVPHPNKPTPSPAEPFSLQEVLKSACPGFDVTGQLSGKSKLIGLPGDRFIGISPGATITLTGPSGKTVSYVITGSTHIQVLLDGSQEIRSTGRNLIIVPEVTGKHLEGLFLTTGNVYYALNPDGTEKRLFSGPGRVTDGCALLGP